MKKTLFSALYLVLFGFLIFFPEESLLASKNGLILWYDSLVPVLLPFLIFSQFLLKSSMADGISRVLEPLFCKIFHCSRDGAFCLFCGFLCGYPVGARLAALLVRENKITAAEGQYLLSFCNNVSPMFCISYGITKAIGSVRIFPYLMIIYGSPLLFGILTRPKKLPPSSAGIQKQTSFSGNIFRLIDVCIIESFEILLKLCGYLVLFSIISSACAMIFSGKAPFLVPLLTAFLELTNGLALLCRLPSGTIRSALCITALTFGGLCCIFQTNSVIENSGLSIQKYLLHKILTALLSLGIFLLWLLLRSFPINYRC